MKFIKSAPKRINLSEKDTFKTKKWVKMTHFYKITVSMYQNDTIIQQQQ